MSSPPPIDPELPIDATSGKIYHLDCAPVDLADRIILVGDPGRSPFVAKYFDKGSITFDNVHREMHIITGLYKGTRVSVLSTGIGCDNVEICLTEIHALKEYDLKNRKWMRESSDAEKPPKVILIRVGTCGCPQVDMKCGELAISRYALGMDNTGTFFVHPNPPSSVVALEKALKEPNCGLSEMPLYAARAAPEVVTALSEAASKLPTKPGFYIGATASASGFYACQGRAVGCFRGTLRYPNLVKNLGDFRFSDGESKDPVKVVNIEMETSILCHMSSMLGYLAGAVCCVVAVRQGQYSAFLPPASAPQAIANGIECALEAIIAV